MKTLLKKKLLSISIFTTFALLFGFHSFLTAAAVDETISPTVQQNENIDANEVVALASRSLSVRVHRTTSLSNGRADAIFRDATRLLRTRDGGGDVACPLTVFRRGGVRSFSTGDGSIDNSRELNQVFNVSGVVKVVRRINFCGGFSPNIIGCAPVPGNSLVVVRFSSSQEGLLWIHEHGHNRGLPHRNNSRAIMFPSVGSSRRQVNNRECNAYL